MPPITPSEALRWAPVTTCPRIRHLRQRYGLSEPAARLLAPFIYGETAQ